jgi:hypothetical protein
MSPKKDVEKYLPAIEIDDAQKDGETEVEDLMASVEPNLEPLSSGSSVAADESSGILKDHTLNMDELVEKAPSPFEQIDQQSEIGEGKEVSENSEMVEVGGGQEFFNIQDEEIEMEPLEEDEKTEEAVDGDVVDEARDASAESADVTTRAENAFDSPEETTSVDLGHSRSHAENPIMDITDCSVIARADGDDAGDIVEVESEDDFGFEDSSMAVGLDTTPGPGVRFTDHWNLDGNKVAEGEIIRGSLGVGGNQSAKTKVDIVKEEKIVVERVVVVEASAKEAPTGNQGGKQASPSKNQNASGGGSAGNDKNGKQGLGDAGGFSGFGGQSNQKFGATGDDGNKENNNNERKKDPNSHGNTPTKPTPSNVKIDLYAESIKELDGLETRLKSLSSVRNVVPGETLDDATERGFAEMRRIMRDFKNLVGKAKEDVSTLHG